MYDFCHLLLLVKAKNIIDIHLEQKRSLIEVNKNYLSYLHYSWKTFRATGMENNHNRYHTQQGKQSTHTSIKDKQENIRSYVMHYT